MWQFPGKQMLRWLISAVVLLSILIGSFACESRETRENADDQPPAHAAPPQPENDASAVAPQSAPPAQAPNEPTPADAIIVTFDIEKPGRILSLLVRPKTDKHGHKPQNVAIAFVNDLAAGDQDAARSWWHDNSNPHRLKPPLGFEAYFLRMRAALRTTDRVFITATGKSKAQYYSITMRFYEDGKITDGELFTLEKIDDEWKLLRSLRW